MADGPFLCYRELLSSTSIIRSTFFFCHNAISAQNDEYLCTLLPGGISLYKVCRPGDSTDGEAFLSLKLNEKLFGKPNDVKVYSYGQNTSDLLVISLDCGKIVMVKYLWERNTLDTIMMCNGEENAYGTGSEVQVQSNGIRRYLGTGNDCSICLCQDNGVVCSTIYGQYLVITPIPASNDTTDLLRTSLAATESQGQSFSVDIGTTLNLTGPIVDACFITGYSRPVLVVLQQTGLLPIGHAGKVRHCCTVTALAVNLEPKTLSVLWQRNHLPHDSVRLVPLTHTAFAGAVGVISLSAVIVVNQEEAQGVATNGFAATTVDTAESYRKGLVSATTVGVKSGAIGLQSWVTQEEGIELDGSYWIEDTSTDNRKPGLNAVNGESRAVNVGSNATSLIGVLKDGTVLRVGMLLSTQRMLSSVLFTPEVVASTIKASCFCTSRVGDLWFLGSRQSSALLLGVSRRSSGHSNRSRRSNHNNSSAGGSRGATSSFLSPSSKRARNAIVVSPELPVNGSAESSELDKSTTGTPHTKHKRASKHASSATTTTSSPVEVIPNEEEAFLNEELQLYGSVLQPVDDEDFFGPESPRHVGSGFIRSRTTASTGEQLRFEIHDSLTVMGPMLHGLVTQQDNLFENVDSLHWDRLNENGALNNTHTNDASIVPERDARDSILFSSGLDEDGAVIKVYNGLHMQKLAERSLPGATRVHSLHYTNSTNTTTKSSTTNDYSIVLISYETKSRVLHCSEDRASQSELQFAEIDPADAGFICNAPTIQVGFISLQEGIVAQIHPAGLRLLKLGSTYTDEAEALQDVNVIDSLEFGGLAGEVGEYVVSGDVCASYAVLVTSAQKMYVLRYDAAEESMELLPEYTGSCGGSGDGISGAMKVEHSANGDLNVLQNSEVVSASLYFGLFNIYPAVAPSPPTTSYIATTTAASAAATATASATAVIGDSAQLTEEHILAQQNKLQQTLEEIYLYGQPLSTNESKVAGEGDDMDISVENAPASGASAANNNANTHRHAANAVNYPPQAYLTVAQLNGTVTVVRLNTQEVIVSTDGFTQLADYVKATTTTTTNTATSDACEGVIVETKLARVYSEDPYHHDDLSRSTLLLTLLLSTGDLVVYSALEVCTNNTTAVVAFNKTAQCTVVNKRVDNTKVVRSVSTDSTTLADTDPTSPTDELATHRAYLNSSEYTTRCGMLTLLPSYLSGRNGILVSGNDTLLITTVHGLPTIVPLALPEVPYINYGHYIAVPLHVGSVSAMATLWGECEDINHLKNPQSAEAKGNRACTLAIYTSTEGVEIFPNAAISIKKVNVGRTVHKMNEILNKTDDRTQKALLEKKTFLLACSEDVKMPFLNTVLTEEELQEDTELYERYFTSLDSFCQPDVTVAQAPPLHQRQHTLALLQNNAVVDHYTLPPNECVVDTEVLYFNVEKYVTLPGALMALRTMEKRVFVAAATCCVEKRGEDTQGNGRLLLFALDYALFEQDEEEGTSGASANCSSAEPPTTKVTNTTTSSTPSTAATTATVATATTATTTDAQAKFLSSIKPKLRLLSAGPGPASVIKQLGDYVLSTVASTVYIYKFNSESMELEQVSFFFAQLYIATVSILKNFILLGDMHHSVQLLLWRPEDHSLNLISKDFEPSVALTTEFLYDGAKLGMVMGDDEGNVKVFQEAPRKMESMQGTRLLCLADFHLGSDASVLLRHDLLSTDPVKKAMPNPLDNRPPPPPPRTRKGSNFPLQKYGTRFNKSTIPAKATLLVGTMDGSIGVLQPLEERMYKRLALMQQIMNMTVPTQLSLNPREYRLYKSARVHLVRKKGVLDGCMLSKFNALPPSLQDQLAATVGATAYLIKENLHELDYLCRYF